MHDYDRIARVIQYLDAHHTAQPDLAALAAHTGLSPFHFHRLFSSWAGVTPKDFLQCLTLAHAKALLQRGDSVLDAARAVGTAIARNPLGYPPPCHRVIRETGIVGDYRWGRTRKRAMLAWESAPCGDDETTQPAAPRRIRG